MGEIIYVLVPGYGCFLTRELRWYLNEVRNFILEFRPQYVILSGGKSQKSAGDISEARVMFNYLTKDGPLCSGTKFVLEEKALTTLENISNAQLFIKQLATVDAKRVRLVVFCEASRQRKVHILTWLIMTKLGPLEMRPVAWERSQTLKQLVSTVLELAAFFFPPLRWGFHQLRLRRAERI